MIKAIKIANDLQNLFFPTTCLGCGKITVSNETILCVECRHQLPLTQFINENDNLTEKIFFGRIKIENAASFLHFHKKGVVQHLIHNLKYKGHEKIGAFFGTWMGSELSQSHRFNDIDMVIPVPLHKKRLRQRGYNQVSEFGKHLAKELQIPFHDDMLQRTRHTKSQAFKDSADRATITSGDFLVSKDELLVNKHILIVDDVVTTGTTLEACINAFPKDKNIKTSIVTIAITS
ncbi:phosphoribosyltransferase family protein [Galbibacter sp. EGI 63066]|uniref:ComF family protein n=1 Tax=Galbibacter sp. EGI 63066 TaxID=2993559 RepID=UPI0022499DE1|nr:phosphoribosyltransferase family protein [Galbibacter sp. EGI 63066]MCX2680539.1 phosphoribosyltransferase family protein [Galbibacter sp. EGI 63066]